MRTCPKCGYRDHQAWRNHRWIIYVTYCEIEELARFDPELHEEIIRTGPTERLPLVKKPFIYVLKKAGYVWRMDYEDFIVYGFNRKLTESPNYQERIRLSEAQQRLPPYQENIK